MISQRNIGVNDTLPQSAKVYFAHVAEIAGDNSENIPVTGKIFGKKVDNSRALCYIIFVWNIFSERK